MVESGAITVSGINAGAPISITNGEYSIAGNAFRTDQGTVNAGSEVRVRLRSSSAHATTSSATLTIGGVSATFEVTTREASPGGTTRSTRIVMITSRLADSVGQFDDAAVRAQFARAKALVERLSYGAHSLELQSIHDIGTSTFFRQELRAWSNTATLLDRVLRNENRDPNSDNCNLDVEGPKAQSLLTNMSEQKKAQSGISINTINLEFARSLSSARCRDFSVGSILATRAKLPETINYANVDIIVYAPYDEEVHAGGFNNGFQFSGIERPSNMTESDANRIEFVMSGALKSTLDQFFEVDSTGLGTAESSSVFLQGALYLQTQFSRITAHEIIHGLGIGTHDNGIDAFTSVSDAQAINTNPLSSSVSANLDYGDWFSIMGTSQYAIGMAPASKENLGWLGSDRMHVITSGTGNQNYTLRPFSSNDGIVAAKISVFDGRGFLYVSFESNKDEYRTLNHPPLVPNTNGALLRFAENRGNGVLTTSVLLDPDGQPSNHDYALKAGDTFSIGGVSITVDQVTENELTFRAAFQ